jgi:hypothetical protein
MTLFTAFLKQSGESKGAAAAEATSAAAPASAAAAPTADEEDEFADVKQFNILNTAGTPSRRCRCTVLRLAPTLPRLIVFFLGGGHARYCCRAGVDKLSRPVLVFYAYNMPEREHLDQDRLLA